MNSTEQANDTMIVTEFYYHAETNQSLGFVTTDMFEQWMSVSGRVSLDEFTRAISHCVQFVIEELR